MSWDFETIKFLLETKDLYFDKWFNVALEAGRLDVLTYLLETNREGVKVDKDAISRAIWKGHAQIVQFFVEQYGDSLFQEWKNTFLYEACFHGHLETFKYLMNKGLDVNYTDRFNSCTLLYTACQRGRIDIVKELANHKDIDLNKSNFKGETPLFVALEQQSFQIVKLLLSLNGIEINKQDDKGRNPLIIAVTQHDHLTIKLLIENGANPNLRLTEPFLYSPLWIAASTKALKSVQELLRAKDIDVNIKNSKGETPLWSIVKQCSDSKIAKFLEKKGIIVPNFGKSLVAIGDDSVSFEIIQMMVEKGARL